MRLSFYFAYSHSFSVDPRFESSKAAILKKSINLTLSARGITALQALDPGASDRLVAAAIPVHSRMVHGVHGGTQRQPYDKHGGVSPPADPCVMLYSCDIFEQGALHSIDRALLNAQFVDDAAATPGVKLFFNHKVQSVNFEERTMLVRGDSGEERAVRFDLCVGADGSYSAVRRMLMKVVRYVLWCSDISCGPLNTYFLEWIISSFISHMSILS